MLTLSRLSLHPGQLLAIGNLPPWPEVVQARKAMNVLHGKCLRSSTTQTTYNVDGAPVGAEPPQAAVVEVDLLYATAMPARTPSPATRGTTLSAHRPCVMSSAFECAQLTVQRARAEQCLSGATLSPLYRGACARIACGLCTPQRQPQVQCPHYQRNPRRRPPHSHRFRRAASRSAM